MVTRLGTVARLRVLVGAAFVRNHHNVRITVVFPTARAVFGTINPLNASACFPSVPILVERDVHFLGPGSAEQTDNRTDHQCDDCKTDAVFGPRDFSYAVAMVAVELDQKASRRDRQKGEEY